MFILTVCLWLNTLSPLSSVILDMYRSSTLIWTSECLIGLCWLFFSFKTSSIAVYTDGNKMRRKTIPKNVSGHSYPELITSHE